MGSVILKTMMPHTQSPDTLRDLVMRNRSCRRFDERVSVARETLVELVDLARCSPSGANVQPLKYMLSWEQGRNDIIFASLSWAGYLREWDGPATGERPTAYIIVLGDRDIRASFGCDHGIAVQSMLLGAAEKGLGGCIVGSFKRDQLRESLSIADRFEILLVVALGKPAEQVVIETAPESGDIRYWRDEAGVHHVPKRRLDDLIVEPPK